MRIAVLAVTTDRYDDDNDNDDVNDDDNDNILNSNAYSMMNCKNSL